MSAAPPPARPTLSRPPQHSSPTQRSRPPHHHPVARRPLEGCHPERSPARSSSSACIHAPETESRDLLLDVHPPRRSNTLHHRNRPRIPHPPTVRGNVKKLDRLKPRRPPSVEIPSHARPLIAILDQQKNALHARQVSGQFPQTPTESAQISRPIGSSCGHASQVASCASHSAGMRNAVASSRNVVSHPSARPQLL